MSKNCFEQKLCFQVFKFYVFLLFIIFFSRYFYELTLQFYHKPKTTVPNTFSLNIFISFLLKSQNCLETCVKCVCNCLTLLFPPPLWIQFKKSKSYSSLIWNARLAPKVTFKRYWWEESWIFLIRGLTSHNFA